VREHRLLLIGAATSVALLAIFLVLQGTAASLLQLPSQWLWVALVPVVACLVAGGYIGKFKASGSGIEFEARVPPEVKGVAEVTPGAKAFEARAAAPWQGERKAEYDRTGQHFLVHVYKPSNQPGQKYDVFVYLVRHQADSIHPLKTGLPEIRQVEFFFGPAWGNQVFTVVNTGSNVLGVRTHAYGTFLATGRVTFSDASKHPVILHRYMDCEMLDGQV
jgi:hypothetical protein